MRAYSSMKTSEFIVQLRDIAVNAKASPLVIDQIDQLEDPSDTEEEHYDNGIDNGRSTQWELCEAAISDALIDYRGKSKLGFTEEQIAAIMKALDQCKPQ